MHQRTPHDDALGRCPVTGLSVEQRAAWRDIELTGGYRVSFSFVGGRVLHTVPHGDAGGLGIPRLFEARREVLEQVGSWDRPHCEIKAYDGIPLRHSRIGRSQFTKLLSAEHERGMLRGYWGYGGPAVFRWIMATAKRLSGHAASPCHFVPDYRAAIQLALQTAAAHDSGQKSGPARRRHREDWVLDLDGYRAHFEIWDDDVIYGRSTGVLRREHVAPFFALYERLLQEPGCFANGTYVQFGDLSALQRIDWPALGEFYRRQLDLNSRYHCRGVVLHGQSLAVQATAALARQVVPFPYLHASEWEQAVRLVRDLPRKPSRPGLLQRLTGRVRHPGEQMKRAVDELVLHAGTINWHVQGPVAPAEDPDDPLAAIYALLRVLKLDFDTMHQEREQMQRQMLQAAKLSSIGRLTAGVAHELNSPLTAVLGYAQQIQEHGGENEHGGEDASVTYAARIVKAAQRMRDVIDQLAVYSRMDPEGPPRALDVNRGVEEALVLIQPLLEKRHLEVECDLAAGLPAIWCERTHLQSMLCNVLTNSFDAYPAEPTTKPDTPRRVKLSSRMTDGWVRIQCRDWGCGMPTDVLSQALDPFFTTKDVGQGTGLGLYVTHLLASNYGGEVLIDSAEAEGTTVTLSFPARNERPSIRSR
ncbi:MAG: ATP-binding protein [bacterium]